METRNLIFEVYLVTPEGDKAARDAAWKALRELFAIYRQTARQAAAVLELAATAGASIVERKDELRIQADNKRAQEILSGAFGKEGKALGYPMRDWIMERFAGRLRSEFADSLLRDVAARWKAPDPKTGVRRNFLILGGARRPPLMAHVPLPFRTRGRTFEAADNGHRLVLRPNAETEINLRLGDLDPGRWAQWRLILAGKYKMGDPVYLHLNDGKLKLRVPYSFEPSPLALDAGRTQELAFTDQPGEFIRFRIREGLASVTDLKRRENLSAEGAVEGVDGNALRADRLKPLIESCGKLGERRHGSGCAPALRRYRRMQSALAGQRARITQCWNHFWSARAEIIARRWKCGKVLVFGPPETLLGRSWPWADFKAKVEYKFREIGATVEWQKPAEVSELTAVGG